MVFDTLFPTHIEVPNNLYKQRKINKLTQIHIFIQRKTRCDPNDTQFEPILVHFERLRQVYETSSDERGDDV